MTEDDHAESIKQAAIDEIYGWALDSFGLEFPSSAVRFAQVISLVKRLQDEGFAILKTGDIPPWMELDGHTDINGNWVDEGWVIEFPDRYSPVYRLSLTPSEEEQ